MFLGGNIWSGLPLSGAARVWAQVSAAQGEQTLSLDFDGVDIKVFIQFISEITGKNFVVDDRVKGTVTVISARQITEDEAFKVFESVLEVNGYTIVPAGKFYKIVPAKGSRTRSLQTLDMPENLKPMQDRMVTQILSLKHIDATELRKMLTPMVSPDGLITDYPLSRTIIITDYSSNIERLLKIITEVDMPTSKAKLSIYRLQYASAKNLAEQINKLMQVTVKRAQGQDSSVFNVVPDERTNTVAIMAGAENTSQVAELIRALDRPSDRGRGNIRIYALENADAEELAKVLNELVGKTTTTAEGKSVQVVTEGTKVVADKTTNSLVITADPESFAVFEETIAKLDVPRKQVFVEALIMEISSDKTFNFGVNWNFTDRSDSLGSSGEGGLVFGSSNPGGFVDLFDGGTFAPPAGLAVGMVTFPVQIGDIIYTNIQTLLNAAKSDNSFNVISTPQLMTLDNEEASINVSENRPFLTSQDVGQSTTDRTAQQFEYRDVGTQLKVTPQINAGNTIKLKIYQETSRVDQQVTELTGQLQPTTRKRTTETTVLVRNGQTIVISGLISKSSTEGVSKVPALGDVPVLGWLFKNKNESSDKTNLLVFITPRIAGQSKEADAIYFEKIKELEEVQFGGHNEGAPIEKPQILYRPVLGS